MSAFTFNNPIPEEYLKPSAKPGRTELVSYDIPNSENPSETITKHARVYLPYGYDSGASRRYNVLYLMHGAGDDHNRWLGTDENPSDFRPLLDNMIANGDIEPIIVVTPCIEEGKQWFAVTLPSFHTEFETALMPLVEGKYRTYAEGDSPDRFKASRDHRAYAGFSLGSAATWFAFVNNLDCVKWFLPMSGDCWAVEKMGGKSATEATAALLAKVAVDSGLSQRDYFIFAGNGTKDVAYPTLTPQIEAMKKHTEAFTFTDTSFDDGNLAYYLRENYEHEYSFVYEYFYNGIKHFFK